MSLEQEIVFRLKEQDHSDQDILETCREYSTDSRIQLSLNEEAVKSALKSYELLQGYNSQNNGREATRKRTKARLEGLIKKFVDELKKDDSFIVDYKVEKLSNGYYCPSCDKSKIQLMQLKLIRIVKESNLYFKRQKMVKFGRSECTWFRYCFSCGEIDKDFKVRSSR